MKNKKRLYRLNLKPLLILLLFFCIISITADTSVEKKDKTPKKILYVASYSLTDAWGMEIISGIKSVLKTRKNLEFKAISMDTMGLSAKDAKTVEKAALEAKQLIDSWKPDVVITSDDNAAKYLIVPYFKNSALPFVFCGVNWDASKYGFPLKNVTGMLEVQLVDQLVKYMTPYAKGKRIGCLRGDTMTNRLEAKHVEAYLGVKVKTLFTNNITEWKKLYKRLQNEVDILLVGDIGAVKINKESNEDLEKFILKNTKIPTGGWDEPYKKEVLITVGTVPAEQGEYAAKTALAILDGKSPKDIPLVENKRAKLILNMKLAKVMGIIFPMDLIESASFADEN